MEAGYKQAKPHEQVETEVMLLAGGPSLSEFEDEIREKRASGEYLITTNGAYNWCVERGIKPSMQVVVDGRDYNKRFVQPHVDGCHYFLASQCNPAILEAAPKEQVYLWHAGSNEHVQETVEDFARKNGHDFTWFPVMGGSTVMLRAIPLLIMLGYHKFHIYGFDSCVMEDKHHAYDQPENDKKAVMDVRLDGKTFKCQFWMWVQAQEFIDIQKMLPDNCEMAVYGNGLISHIINTAAKKAQE